MRGSQIALLACALATLLFSGCERTAPGSADLALAFTCDTRGKLEPCGCFAGQFGGLTRLMTFLETTHSTNTLRVDVGDATAGSQDFDEIHYGYMLRAFAAMHFDAANVGAREAGFSATQLRRIRQKSPVPIISANLLDTNTGKPLLKPYVILQKAGRRIAVIGVVDPRSLKPSPGDGLMIAGMEPTLAEHLPRLRAQADLVVLLAFTDEVTLARLADQFYEAQVILGGNVSQPAQELKRVNRSLVYYVTNEGRAAGLLRLRLGERTPPTSLENRIVFLHDLIPQDDRIKTLAQAARAEIRTTRLLVDDPAHRDSDAVPGVRRSSSYTGTARCAECHRQAAAEWAKSAHAKAFTSLRKREADADPNCIPCHTIGFGKPSGYLREYGSGRLVDVGCESCHGPGSLHVKQREGDKSINFNYRPLGAGDCLKCHHGEFSRPFSWDEFWPLIRHSKETLPTASAG